MVEDARNRLQSQPAYQSRIQAYAAQDMLPVDLEHMMISEADELIRRADRHPDDRCPQNPLIQQLRDKAGELIATGREMRTRQSLSTKKPTDGMLEDLLDPQAVEIVKPVPLKTLGKRRDRSNRPYAGIRNMGHDGSTRPAAVVCPLSTTPSRPAFLRNSRKPTLKLPEHRALTHADDPNLPYADIGKKSAALETFDHGF